MIEATDPTRRTGTVISSALGPAPPAAVAAVLVGGQGVRPLTSEAEGLGGLPGGEGDG